MRHLCGLIVVLCWAVPTPLRGQSADHEPLVQCGEQLDPAQYGPGVVEPLSAAVARDQTTPPGYVADPHARNGAHGSWVVPSRRSTYYPHSGQHNVVNKWGDTRMGIGFGRRVDVEGAYIAGQAGEGVWTTGLRVIGYRDGSEVAVTEWFEDIASVPGWFAMNLVDVDRIVFEAKPVINGGGWYALDDLTYRPRAASGDVGETTVAVDFEDCQYEQKLTGTGYAGLIWEGGTGVFEDAQAIHAPKVPPETEEEKVVSEPGGGDSAGTLPQLQFDFQGVIRGDAGSSTYPPDTCGAVGPDHFVEVINRNFAVYDKLTGEELINIRLGSFLPGSNGDPRVLFDQYSGRWIVHVCDFSASTTIYLAVSLTDDPTGNWFKTWFVTGTGPNSGCWPDYPTLGVDEAGIYVGAYMVGGCGMSIWAIDKAPLIAPNPSLGTITVFPLLPFEGAIQPVHSYGDPPGEYCVSRQGSTRIRVRRIDGPMTSPTLIELGSVTVPSHSSPPDVPALGSSTPLDSVDHRFMNAVYRDGSVWTAHTIGYNNRTACRWYEIDAGTLVTNQVGTISDGLLYYFFPGISVNTQGDMVIGFSGANANQYAACYYTGRLADDPPGETAPPALLKAGEGPHNLIDSYGRNRWGDYSLTTLDPSDELTLWTIQEYGHTPNQQNQHRWGTWIGKLSFHNQFGDFDGDGDVDLYDYSEYLNCVTGPGGAAGSGCEVFDAEPDGDIDMTDFARVQEVFTGQCGVSILTQPQDAFACPGGAVTFEVEADGQDLTYQWFHNVEIISGANGPSLLVDPVVPDSVGVYTVLVSGGCASRRSEPAELIVAPGPEVTAQPQNASSCPGQPAEFTVEAVGVEPLRYQWRFNNQNIGGATNATYMIPFVGPENAGEYHCAVTDDCEGTTVSDPAVLLVQAPVEFVTQPLGGAFCVGQDITLFVIAQGAVTYQWYKDGEAIPGATQFFLDILNAQHEDSGSYYVDVIGQCDAGTSEVAEVVVQECP